MTKESLSTTEIIKRRLLKSTALTAGALALTACGSENGNPDYAQRASAAMIGEGFIADGVNVRFEPVRIEDSSTGENNTCATPDTAVVFSSVEGKIAYQTDANGDWVGFELSDMPANVQEACADDSDGMVWVNRPHVNADVTEVTVAID